MQAMATKFCSTMALVHITALMTPTADDYAAEVFRRETDPQYKAVYVRLTGLCGATHLNGQEGALKG